MALVEYNGWLIGRSRVFNEHAGILRGKAKVTYLTRSGILRGKHKILVERAGILRGLGRVANDALARWEVFIGDGALPTDFSTPDATEADTALPHTFNVDVTGYGGGGSGLEDLDLYIVTRKRNKYGLQSKNLKTYHLITDGSGDQVEIGPSDVENLVVVAYTPDAGTTVFARVKFDYFIRADEAESIDADSFEVSQSDTGCSAGIPYGDVLGNETIVNRSKADGVVHFDEVYEISAVVSPL